MQLHRLGSARPQIRRVRFAGVGLAALGAMGLGLVVVPNAQGGGGVGDNVVHLQGAAAPVALAVSGSVAPDCGGGGGAGSDD